MQKSRKTFKIAFVGNNQAGLIGALTVLSAGHVITTAVCYSTWFVDILSSLGIDCFESLRAKGFRKKALSSDILLCVHGREIVDSKLLNSFRFGCINVHPYLYAYKGSAPIARALQESNLRASVGVHYMTDKIDCGKVICEDFMKLKAARSQDEVYNQLYPVYCSAILKVLDKLRKKK